MTIFLSKMSMFYPAMSSCSALASFWVLFHSNKIVSTISNCYNIHFISDVKPVKSNFIIHYLISLAFTYIGFVIRKLHLFRLWLHRFVHCVLCQLVLSKTFIGFFVTFQQNYRLSQTDRKCQIKDCVTKKRTSGRASKLKPVACCCYGEVRYIWFLIFIRNLFKEKFKSDEFNWSFLGHIYEYWKNSIKTYSLESAMTKSI